jgi:hypothetical protein
MHRSDVVLIYDSTGKLILEREYVPDAYVWGIQIRLKEGLFVLEKSKEMNGKYRHIFRRIEIEN